MLVVLATALPVALLCWGREGSSARFETSKAGHMQGNSRTFVDPVGDNGNGSAPDITQIRWSNDDQGSIELRIAFHNRTDVLPTDWISIVLDADSSAATGCNLGGFGMDFEVRVHGDLNATGLWRFSAATCSGELLDSLPFGFDAASGTLVVRLRTVDVGSPRGFRFGISATYGELQPDGSTSDFYGFDFYEIVVAPPTPPRDTTRPRVKALTSSGAPGRIARLRYSVFEETGRAREQISIYRGRSLLDVKHIPFGRRSATKIYVTRWRIPKNIRGALRFCVQAWDATDNRSAPSCARIVAS